MKNEAYQLYANIRTSTPSIGDLVRIKSDITNPEEAGDVFGVLGIVIGTTGPRCNVQWATGDRTLPERQVLEVVA